MQAIGIDIGTTSICAVVIDCKSGDVIKSVNQNSEAFIITPNDWEKIQNPEKIINTALKIADELINDKTRVIGITGQMHGIVYYDEEGTACSPLFTWQDGRGNLMYDDNNTYAGHLKLSSGYGTVTDFYNRRNNLRPPQAKGYCTIHDYFAMVLTGNKTPIIHTSDAASFGGFDLDKKCFEFDFDGRITSDFEVVGEYKGVPVSVAVGDNQASVFGTLDSSDSILLNVGTGSQISVISSQRLSSKNIEVRPYNKEEWLIVGSALCGGRAYSMLEKFYSDIVYYATGQRMNMYDVMGKMKPEADLLPKADTRFDGTRYNPKITGRIYDITVDNFTPAGIRYAFMYGIINELYNLFIEIGVTGSILVGSGNGIRKNRDLVRIAEDMFAMQLKIPKHTEEAAYGACLIGLAAIGYDEVHNIKKLIKYV